MNEGKSGSRSLREWLIEWKGSDDVAILNYAQQLAGELNQTLELPQTPLPGFYRGSRNGRNA